MIKYLLVSFITCVLTFVSITVIFFKPSNKFSIGEKIVFRSENGEFEFTTDPSKGRGYKIMERAFIKYKLKMGLNEDLKIYRTTKKNYINISRWCSYKTFPEWQYPYKK